MRIRYHADPESPSTIQNFESLNAAPPTGGYAKLSSVTGDSSSYLGSNASVIKYEIWRTWDQCLIFQDALETYYTELAREKRAAFQAMQRRHERSMKALNKRHSKAEVGGLYSTRMERTASFASLPTGADPRMVVMDVHQFVPKLTLKGSVFKTSAADVQKQADELVPFVEALWGPNVDDEDLPALLRQTKEEMVGFFMFGAEDLIIAKRHGLGANWEINVSPSPYRSMTTTFTSTDSASDWDRQSFSSSNSSSFSDSRSEFCLSTGDTLIFYLTHSRDGR